MRIKVKYLQDRKENGFILPNWLLYYQAYSLVLLKDFITLNNVETLTLEGHNLPSEWYSYFGSEGKTSTNFTNRYLRSLIKTWKNLKSLLYLKMLLWISPREAISNLSSFTSRWYSHLSYLSNEKECKERRPYSR